MQVSFYNHAEGSRLAFGWKMSGATTVPTVVFSITFLMKTGTEVALYHQSFKGNALLVLFVCHNIMSHANTRHCPLHKLVEKGRILSTGQLVNTAGVGDLEEMETAWFCLGLRIRTYYLWQTVGTLKKKK